MENNLVKSKFDHFRCPHHLLVRFRIGVDSDEQCYTELEDHFKWRKEKMPPIVTTWAATLIEGGFIYVHGRDY